MLWHIKCLHNKESKYKNCYSTRYVLQLNEMNVVMFNGSVLRRNPQYPSQPHKVRWKIEKTDERLAQCIIRYESSSCPWKAKAQSTERAPGEIQLITCCVRLEKRPGNAVVLVTGKTGITYSKQDKTTLLRDLGENAKERVGRSFMIVLWDVKSC